MLESTPYAMKVSRAKSIARPFVWAIVLPVITDRALHTDVRGGAMTASFQGLSLFVRDASAPVMQQPTSGRAAMGASLPRCGAALIPRTDSFSFPPFSSVTFSLPLL